MPQIDTHHEAVQASGLISRLKALKAQQTGDARWLTLRPPLLPATANMAGPLTETILEIKSTDVDKRGKKLRINALRRERVALNKYAHRIMAMQAFLMAGDHAKIANPRV